jgi:hypothetical protein
LNKSSWQAANRLKREVSGLGQKNIRKDKGKNPMSDSNGTTLNAIQADDHWKWTDAV